jgi:4-carboxymuconolactone decarboxylase
MDERERFELGTRKRRKVLGDAWVDRSVSRQNEFNAEFLDLISRYAWGEIWN